jgi:hypothetical protein
MGVIAAGAVLAAPLGALAQTQAQAPAAAGATQNTTYTDAQLQSFASASAEIDPINRTLASASAEQRTAATAQIRGILQRNNLDSATYNAIAAQAQTDTALAARINTLRAPGHH